MVGVAVGRCHYGDWGQMDKNCEVHTLVYPQHEFQPEDLLNFIKLDWFVKGLVETLL